MPLHDTSFRKSAVSVKRSPWRSAVGKRERGEAAPGTAKLPALGRSFGVSPEELPRSARAAEEQGKDGENSLPRGKPLDKRGNAHKINLLSAWMGRKPGRPSSESRRPLRAGGGALGYWPRSVSPESTSRAGRQAAVTGHGPLGAAERRPGDRRRDQGGTAFSNAPEPLGSGAYFRKGKMLR